MAVAVPALFRDPLFLAGAALRVGLIFLLIPATHEAWFLPFFEDFLARPTIDPWSHFLASGGNALSFPYGPAMFLAHLPYVALGKLVDIALATDIVTGIGFRFSLFVADIAVLVFLTLLFPRQRTKVIVFYWFSPIVLFVTYWHGQTDIVPVAIFLLAMVLLKNYRAAGAGGVMAAAVSAKLSMVVALPFIAVYLWRNKKLHSLIMPFAVGFAAVFAVGFAVWLASPGFRSMVLGSREIGRIYHLALPLGDVNLYLAPILFGAALYGVWRLSRMSFELMFAATGLSYFLLVLMTPAPPGWYLWLVPFFVAHQIGSRYLQAALVFVFSLLVIGYHFVLSSGAVSPVLGLDLTAGLANAAGFSVTEHQRSLVVSGITLVGMIIIVQMLRNGIRDNDHFRIGRRPISIAIAGDSGAGKDTLARNLAGVFGQNMVTHISGDDYHRWDRYAPMWKALTHLDPRANDLSRFVEDVSAALDGKTIECHLYDHGSGRFSAPRRLRSNDVIIISGLHALRDRSLLERFDISIFIDPSDELRREWKVRRDVGERGHTIESVTSAFERRRHDSERFIRPQKENADVLFGLTPANPNGLVAEEARPPRLKLDVVMRDSIYHERLARVLVGLCGMHVDTTYLDDPGQVAMTIEGDLEPADVALAVATVAPQVADFLDIHPKWENGMAGVMQSVVLMQLESQLRRRR